MRRPIKIKQAEIARAVKAATAAGLKVQRIEVDAETGKVSLQIDDGSRATPETSFDAWRAARARSP